MQTVGDIPHMDERETYRQRIVDFCMKSEADLHSAAISAVAQSLKGLPSGIDLLSKNEAAATSQETLSYWRKRIKRESLPALLRYIFPLIEAEEQPVFAAVSLCSLENSSTNLVPIPYINICANAETFGKAFLISGDATIAPPTLLEEAARTASHALVNISYSIRLDDEPIEGWLAAAHVNREAIYLSDVMNVSSLRHDVRTAASREEPFMGMASVVYLPIYDSSQKGAAPAVLMLWSPCPRRWNGVLSPNAKNIIEHPSLCEEIWDRLSWLEVVANREFANQRRAELEQIGYFLTMQSWADTLGADVGGQFRKFQHGTLELLENLFYAKKSQVSVRQWVKNVLTKPTGLSGYIWQLKNPDFRSESLLDAPVLLRRGTIERRSTLSGLMSDVTPIEEVFDETAYFAFKELTATNLANEVGYNIAKYAKEINGIEIAASSRYVTLLIEQAPLRSETLVGTQKAFNQYYAVRRGLGQPLSEKVVGQDWSGIGHWLYRILSDHVGVFNKLYVPAEGGNPMNQLAIRIVNEVAAR